MYQIFYKDKPIIIADNISEKIESEFELKKHAFYAYGKFKGKNIHIIKIYSSVEKISLVKSLLE